MPLSNPGVTEAQADTSRVLVTATNDRQRMVLASIPTIHLEDTLGRESLSPEEANLVVQANIGPFGRIISAKYDRGDFIVAKSGMPTIEVTLVDIQASGEDISASVLETGGGFDAR